MQKFDIQMAAEKVRDASAVWAKAQRDFQEASEKVTTRLLHEAAANFMSAEQIAPMLGMSVKRVREKMRKAGLSPSLGKRALAAHAAEALAENSSLLGMAPHEMDLTSPLAYLPAGSVLRQEITDRTTQGVTDLPVDPLVQRGYWCNEHQVLCYADDFDGLACNACGCLTAGHVLVNVLPA